MSRCTTQPNALRPRVEIFPEAVVVFALAWLEKNQKNNNNNYNNSIKKKEKLSNGKYRRGRLVLHWVDARTDPNYQNVL